MKRALIWIVSVIVGIPLLILAGWLGIVWILAVQGP